MKKFFIAGLSLFALSCEAGRVDAGAVPSPVISSFNLRYPDAVEVEWEKDRKGGVVIYKAGFSAAKQSEAEFDEHGNFIREE